MIGGERGRFVGGGGWELGGVESSFCVFISCWGGSEEWVGVVVAIGGLVGWKSEDHVR